MLIIELAIIFFLSLILGIIYSIHVYDIRRNTSNVRIFFNYLLVISFILSLIGLLGSSILSAFGFGIVLSIIFLKIIHALPYLPDTHKDGAMIKLFGIQFHHSLLGVIALFLMLVAIILNLYTIPEYILSFFYGFFIFFIISQIPEVREYGLEFYRYHK